MLAERYSLQDTFQAAVSHQCCANMVMPGHLCLSQHEEHVTLAVGDCSKHTIRAVERQASRRHCGAEQGELADSAACHTLPGMPNLSGMLQVLHGCYAPLSVLA